MITMRRTAVLASLLLFGAAGCDLDVTNPNQPETERVLATPTDVESLIAGSYSTWWHHFAARGSSTIGLGPLLSVMSNQHSAWPANFGMVDRTTIPRTTIPNDPAYQFATNFESHWYGNYAAISAATDGLVVMRDANLQLGEGGAGNERARAFAKFVLGLAHGHLALIYDQAFILDETTPRDPVSGMPQSELVPYDVVMAAALGYLEEAAQIAEANTFTIPTDWMSVTVSSAELARLAHGYMARFRAQVARNPEERAQGSLNGLVDWNRIIADAERGVTTTFRMEIDDATWSDWNRIYMSFFGWSQMPYFIHGMADQSGKYQRWHALPIGQKHPVLPNGDTFNIVTPDLRFPQGATLAEQRQNPGRYLHVPTGAASPGGVATSGGIGGQWGQAGRGTWRWSVYREWRNDYYLDAGYRAPVPEMNVHEMRLLQAEGHYRTGNPGRAAELVNVTRTENGLSATNAAGTNTSCVPRLPDGSCGGLLEMIKWELRLETYTVGFAPWYFHGRGWGELVEGSFVHAPVPAKELQVLQLPVYTFGGPGQPGGAPVGIYGF